MTLTRYIDADKLVETCERIMQDPWSRKTAPCSWTLAYNDFIGEILQQPSADVAPRAEIAKEICCKIEEEIVAALESNYSVRAERLRKPRVDSADEFVALLDGKIAALRGIEYFVEELKKKYTEEK